MVLKSRITKLGCRKGGRGIDPFWWLAFERGRCAMPERQVGMLGNRGMGVVLWRPIALHFVRGVLCLYSETQAVW